MASELLNELMAQGKKPTKQATTVRLFETTIRRLKAQEKKWDISMSYIIEKALGPVLDELEEAQAPSESDD